MKHSKIEIGGAEGVRLETGALALEVTLGLGPRITSFASKKGGAGNLFLEISADEEDPKIAPCKLRGGHRLWHAPEAFPRTYQPDNDPVAVKPLKRGLALAQPTETATGLQKAMKVELVGERTVRVTHALTNHGLWPVETAAWVLTMFRPGGYAVLPLWPKGDHAAGDFLPSYSLVPWTYTDFSARCWEFHPDHIGIEVSRAPGPQKIGITGYPGWSAYYLEGVTFVKHAALVAGAVYPDRGCAFEAFTNGRMCELETLSPLVSLPPGGSIQHVEHWTLLNGLKKPDGSAAFGRLKAEVEAWLKEL